LQHSADNQQLLMIHVAGSSSNKRKQTHSFWKWMRFKEVPDFDWEFEGARQ